MVLYHPDALLRFSTVMSFKQYVGKNHRLISENIVP